MLEDIIKTWGGYEVTAMDVYKDMFKFGEGYLQKRNEPKGLFKTNPVAYWKNDDEEKGHYRVMFEDDFEDILKEELQSADFSILNGITYFGRRNVQSHASKMFAMIFDLDGVNDTTLNAFMSGAFIAEVYPIPNYIILSGHGMHLYYLFDTPIPLFPNLKLQLKEFKYALTERLWNGYTSTLKSRQIQGINQGFRVIGGKTKEDAPERIVRAFHLNTHPFSLNQLGEYVPDAVKVDEKKLFRETKMTLKEAQKKYPEWYERVIIGHDKTRTRWRIEEKVNGNNPYALYDWWKDKIREGAAYTHRYYCLMCLAIYGAKCNVPFEQVKKDAYDFVPFLNSINPDEPFKESDAKSALDCYDLRYCTFPLKDIETVSAISIPRNKRNGQKQADHLEEARAIRDVRMKRQGRKWTDGNGRPVGSGTKEEMIKNYMQEHPNDSVTAIAKALGVSRTTVYKYKTTSLDYWQQGTGPRLPMKEKFYEYKVDMPDGTYIMIESKDPDLSDYDQMRLARVKMHLSMVENAEKT